MSAFRLTVKERKCADAWLEHGDGPRAYREAGYKCESWSDNMIRVEVHRVLHRPNVALYIEERQAVTAERVQRRVEYNKEIAVRMALDDWELARKLGQTGAAVSANKLAAQITDVLIEKRDITHRRISDTPTDELEAELAAIKRELRTEDSGETRH